MTQPKTRPLMVAALTLAMLTVGFGGLSILKLVPAPDVPRLVISGGTASERGQVQSGIDRYQVKVPRGTKIEIVDTIAPERTAGVAEVVRMRPVEGTWWRICFDCTNISILKAVVDKGGDYLDAVVIHEVAHAAQFTVAGKRFGKASSLSRSMWPQEGEAESFELEADCLLAQVAGADVANRHGSYLEQWGKTCDAAQLEAARQLWSAVE